MKKLLSALSLCCLMGSSVAFASDSAHDHHHHDHSAMDNSKMDHSGMSMEGMSDVGMLAEGSKPDKVVHVILSDDMKITFKKEVKIEENDVVQFVVMNTGSKPHQFAIGSKAEHMQAREMMKSMPDHHNKHSITVQPGKAGQLLWHFHGDKNVLFACNIAGNEEMIKELKL